jgi:hypothetical protein
MNKRVSSERRSLYRVSLVVLLLLGLIVLIRSASTLFTQPEFLRLDDFVEYWSAGKLMLQRGNPYDPSQMEALQREIGRTYDVPVMMWNPPWTLALVMPFSLMAYPLSRTLWFLAAVFAVFLCADWLWRFYGGSERFRWVSWLVAFTFGPPLHGLKAGQISPFLLLGIVGFLFFIRRKQDGWAGGVLILASVKPHLVYLVGAAVLCWAIDRRRWAVLIGGGFVLLVAMGITLGVNPVLLDQYQYAVTHYPPERWATATLGAVLRMLFGIELFWLQFVPSVLGGIWFVGYWWRHRAAWDWREQMPLIALVSVLTSAYGWTYDYTIALLGLLPVAAVLSRGDWRANLVPRIGLLSAYLAFDVLALFSSMDQVWYWWMASFLLGWYVLARRFIKTDAR